MTGWIDIAFYGLMALLLPGMAIGYALLAVHEPVLGWVFALEAVACVPLWCCALYGLWDHLQDVW